MPAWFDWSGGGHAVKGMKACVCGCPKGWHVKTVRKDRSVRMGRCKRTTCECTEYQEATA